MIFAAITILLLTYSIIMVLAQYFFLKLRGRIFWRAFIPLYLRRSLFPHDKVVMDSSAIMEEFVALFLTGSFFMFPLIVVHSIGLLKIF